MLAFPDDEDVQNAFKVLYYLNPLLTLLFYVLAATISVCALQTISVKARYYKVSRKSILWLMLGVAATYVRSIS